MAVKTITNPHPKQKVNRGNEVSYRPIDNRMSSNTKRVIPAGKGGTKSHSIHLKDIDMAMMSHLKNVMNIHVTEAGERIKLPVYYGNEERWAAIKRRGAIRDRQGGLILPLMTFRRTNVVMTDAMPFSFDQDVQGKHIQVHRAKQYSPKNRYSKFSVQNGLKPVTQSIVTGMPDFVDCTYEFFIWTSYTEQMNTILEAFIEHENTYWGDEHNYRFVAALEGGFQDVTEQELERNRVVSSNFSIVLKGYVFPEFNRTVFGGHASEAFKSHTISKVVFGYEGDATNKQVKGE